MKSMSIERRWSVIATSAAVLGGIVVLSQFVPKDLAEGAAPKGQFVSSRTEGETAVASMPTAREIEHVYLDNFEEKVLRSEVPVLVDFYADWCGPCKALAPVLEEFAQETPDAKIVKINVDENPELAAHYRIESIPSLLVFRDSRVTDRHRGMANKESLQRLLSRRPPSREGASL